MLIKIKQGVVVSLFRKKAGNSCSINMINSFRSDNNHIIKIIYAILSGLLLTLHQEFTGLPGLLLYLYFFQAGNSPLAALSDLDLLPV